MGGVLGFLRVAQEAQREVVDGAAVLLVDLPEFRPSQRPARLGGLPWFCQRLAHNGLHPGLDSIRPEMSRPLRPASLRWNGPGDLLGLRSGCTISPRLN